MNPKPDIMEVHKKSMMRAVLEAAGFEPSDLRLAMRRTREALNAKKVVIATSEGQISDERAYVDHGTRMEAADRIFKMIPGMYAVREGGSGVPFTVEVITMGVNGDKTLVRVHGQ